MTIATPQLVEFFPSTDPKIWCPTTAYLTLFTTRSVTTKTKQWALRHFPLTDVNEWCTCWHEFEDSSSTIAQPGNLELAAQVWQLEQEGCVAGILGHDLQHKQQHVTDSASISFTIPLLHFSSGQWYLCAWKSQYALHPLRSFLNVAFETVPVFLWLMMTLPRPFKEDHQMLPLSMPLSSISLLWCPRLYACR